jgi:predicted transcriptional regulator
MIIRSTKITINRIRKPKETTINDELQWFFDSLGLLGTRDRNKSCFRMVIILLKSLRSGEGLTSDEISERVSLSRGTVVHHLHKLMDSGVVISNRGKYFLRVDNLSSLIDELEQDLYKTMTQLRAVAKDIDKRLEL